jgi:hypothetical protein
MPRRKRLARDVKYEFVARFGPVGFFECAPEVVHVGLDFAETLEVGVAGQPGGRLVHQQHIGRAVVEVAEAVAKRVLAAHHVVLVTTRQRIVARMGGIGDREDALHADVGRQQGVERV